MESLKDLLKAKDKQPLVENNIPVHLNSPERRAQPGCGLRRGGAVVLLPHRVYLPLVVRNR
jgi:hypothetical protein